MKTIRKILSIIYNGISDWKESLISIPVVTAVWLLYPLLFIDKNDNEAPAGWGPIYVQKILFAIAMVFVASTTSWIALKVHRNEIFRFSNKNTNEELTVWQKNLLLLGWFALFSLVFAIALSSL